MRLNTGNYTRSALIKMNSIRPKHNTWEDLWSRWRGIILLSSIPILLILAVFAIMPRSGPATYKATKDSSEELPTIIKVQDGVQTVDTGKLSRSEKSALKYAVVIDAGSTGSRVHVYKFDVVNGKLDLDTDTFEQLKPGLSSFAGSPSEGAASLDPLLKVALSTVPEELQKSTLVKVGATAGLRLLPGKQADRLLAAVSAHLKKTTPFMLDSVSIIDGADEGGFAWLTLNYLLGHLGQSEDKTVAAIDLGGGSVQMAYAMSAAASKTAPKGYITPLSGAGKSYDVYVHSYLGFGMMAARAAVLDWEEAAEANPCVPLQHSGAFAYGGKDHSAKASLSGANFEACTTATQQVMAIGKDCKVPQAQLAQCTFNGAWGGSTVPAVFYISSYFWDRATDVGLIPSDKSISVVISPLNFRTHGETACNTALADLPAKFPSVEAEQLPYLCMDLSFLHTLLTGGFKVPESTKVTVVKKIKYKKNEVEAAWPLGAAINLLSASL